MHVSAGKNPLLRRDFATYLFGIMLSENLLHPTLHQSIILKEKINIADIFTIEMKDTKQFITVRNQMICIVPNSVIFTHQSE